MAAWRWLAAWVIVTGAAGSGALAQIGPDLPLDAELRSGATRTCRADVTPPPPRVARSPNAVAVLPPQGRPYFGAYQIPAHRPDFNSFKATFGHAPPILFSFHDWYADTNGGTRPDLSFSDPMEGENGRPPLEFAADIAAEGTVLALAWAVYCCDIESMAFWTRLKRPYDHFQRIIDGREDAFIRETARKVRAFGRPIMLTVVPEMNWQGQFAFGRDGRSWMESVDDICGQYGDPAWPDGPERIRDVFRRVIDLFREEGAHNVTWFMYSGSQYMAPVEGQSKWLHPRFYYPGDGYIDWVGQSVYFLDPAWGLDIEDTGTFEEVFAPGHAAWRSVTQRPMLLAEFGILADEGRDRRALWERTLRTYLTGKPGVAAVTVADSELFRLYFSIPRVGASAQETALVRRLIGELGYTTRLRTGRAP